MMVISTLWFQEYLQQFQRVFMKNKTDTIISLNRIAFTFPMYISYTRNMDAGIQSCIDDCNVQLLFFARSSMLRGRRDFLSRGALEGRLLYRDLLASFVACAINYEFIGQAGG